MLTKAAKYQKSSTKHFYYVAWTYYEMSKKTTYYKLPFFAFCLHKVGSELIPQNNNKCMVTHLLKWISQSPLQNLPYFWNMKTTCGHILIRAFIREKVLCTKKWKKFLGCHIIQTWQILKRFARSFHPAYTSNYFWRVSFYFENT